MLESRGAEARLTIVDEHIAHEVAHRLEPLVATFGDEPEWHNKPRGNSCTVTAIRDFCAALFEGFPDLDLDVREKQWRRTRSSSRPKFEGPTVAAGWEWLRRERRFARWAAGTDREACTTRRSRCLPASLRSPAEGTEKFRATAMTCRCAGASKERTCESCRSRHRNVPSLGPRASVAICLMAPR